MKRIIYGTLLATGMLLAGVGATNANELDYVENNFSSDAQLFGTAGLGASLLLLSNSSSNIDMSITFVGTDVNSVEFFEVLSLSIYSGMDVSMSTTLDGLGSNNQLFDYFNNDWLFDNGDGDEEIDEIIVVGRRNGNDVTFSVSTELLAMLGMTIGEYLWGPNSGLPGDLEIIGISGPSDTTEDSDERTDSDEGEEDRDPVNRLLHERNQYYQQLCNQPDAVCTLTIRGRIHMA